MIGNGLIGRLIHAQLRQRQIGRDGDDTTTKDGFVNAAIHETIAATVTN